MPAPLPLQKLGHDPIDHATLVNQQELKLIITDTNPTTGLTYIGKAAPGTATSDPYWQIKREYNSGTLKVEEYADGGAYTQIFDNRGSIFPPVTAFVNQYSLNFDGVNDYLALGSAFNYERNVPFSMFFWVKDGGGSSTKYLMGKQLSTAAATGWGIYLDTATVNPRVTIRNAGGNRILITGNAGLTTGVWYHVGFTYDGSSTAAGTVLYVNGAAQAVTIGANNLTATILNAAQTTLGARNGATEFHLGKIDEVTAWSGVLSAANVANLYASGWRSPNTQSYAATLTNWWRNGDGDTFPTITDRVGVQNGTMTNMANLNIVLDAPL